MEERFSVKVDVSSGTVEIEGPEPFVREMLDRYAHVMARPEPPARGGTQKNRKAARKQAADKVSTPPKGKRGRGGRVEIDDKLKDQLQKQRQALQAYLAKRKVTSHRAEAVVIAGFLKEELNRPFMNETEYVTALRVAGRKLPGHARQVLTDAKNQAGLFLESGDSFELSALGHNFVEHDSLKSEGSD